MGSVIQDTQQRNHDRQPRWDRFERADLFEHYRELRAQGLSQRQAAQELQVPRTTLQAWRTWHDTLDICPDVARFFQSGHGLAFVHRLVLAFHLTFDIVVNPVPTVVDGRTCELRVKLMQEEFDELKEALAAEDLSSIAKEMADLLYVVYGTAVSYGID